MKEYHWHLLGNIPGNHRFYRCQLSGKVSACDSSGDYPHQTDDGPLWIEEDKPIVLFESPGSAGMWASVPVVSERTGDHCTIGSGAKEIIWLLRNLGMTITIKSIDYIDEEPVVKDQLDLVPGKFTQQFVPLGEGK